MSSQSLTGYWTKFKLFRKKWIEKFIGTIPELVIQLHRWCFVDIISVELKKKGILILVIFFLVGSRLAAEINVALCLQNGMWPVTSLLKRYPEVYVVDYRELFYMRFILYSIYTSVLHILNADFNWFGCYEFQIHDSDLKAALIHLGCMRDILRL